jgi:Alpha/beta hydrolase family
VSHPTLYRTVKVDGLSIFYREAGPKDAPAILLLHGLPSSSRMFEPLFARLSDRFHLIAPDYPGFGHSDWPDPKKTRVYFRSLRRDNGSLHRCGWALALRALHAGLRRPSRFPHVAGASGACGSSHRSRRGRTQRRPGRELDCAVRVLEGSSGQRKHASDKSAVAGGHADAPRRERSQRRTL